MMVKIVHQIFRQVLSAAKKQNQENAMDIPTTEAVVQNINHVV